ncbi:MAG: hypothetical protein M3O91_04260 [Chloroflexota bacterium]|nr:hypothetical protein [Chloroflexota bacterium]
MAILDAKITYASANEPFSSMGARPALLRTLRARADALEAAGRGAEATERRAQAHALESEMGLAAAT